MTESNQQVEVEETKNEETIAIGASGSGAKTGEKRVAELLGMQNILSQIKSQRNQENEYRRMMLGDDAEEIAKVLDERLEKLTLEQVKKLSDEEVNALFETEEGSLEINTAIFKDPAKQVDYKRSTAVFLKEFAEINAEMDRQTEAIEKEIEDSRDEYNAVMAEFGSLEDYSRTILNRQIDDPATPEAERARLIVIRTAMDDALTFRPLIEFYTANPSTAANTIADFKSKSRAQDVYNRYKRIMIKLGNKQDLANYDDLENLLDEQYHAYAGLLAFSIMRHLRYSTSPSRHREGVLAAQICTNMLKFKQGTLNEQQRATFKASAQQLLDLFI